MSADRLLIRADACSQIGVGHVMRCLALAQEWLRQDGLVTYVCVDLPNALGDRLHQEGIEVVRLSNCQSGEMSDAKFLVEHIHRLLPNAVVLDGYRFGDGYERKVKQSLTSSKRLLAFDDDHHAEHQYADFVLNQNLGADETSYGSREGLLVGSTYALLRREFLDAPAKLLTENEVEHVLITLGGAGSSEVTELLLNSLAGLGHEDLRIRAIVGSAAVQHQALKETAARDRRVELMAHTDDMASQYQWADVAISAGGSTNWEMCYFGIPRCSVILADNQRPVIAALAEAGATLNLGWHHELSRSEVDAKLGSLLSDGRLRQSMSAANRTCVDGQGAGRVVQAIRLSHEVSHE